VIRGQDAVIGLKSAVVVANIFRNDIGTMTFAYPPVNFDQSFDYDKIIYQTKVRLVLLIIGGVVLATVGVLLVLKTTKRRSQAGFEDQIRSRDQHVRTVGIPMSELPSQSIVSDTQPSEDDSARKSVDEGQVGPKEDI